MNLIDTLNKIGHPSILVIGDLILDRYVWGKVKRISPEAPIQILNVNALSREIRLGGAANVAHNLVTLGARVNCLGVAGRDEGGYQLKKKLHSLKINTSGIIIDRNHITPIKTRFIAYNQQVLRVDEENSQDINKQTEQKLLAQFKKAIARADLVIVSDYLKGTLTNSLMRSICRISRSYNKTLIIGPKGKDYRKYRGATGLVFNRSEAGMLTGIEIKDNKSRSMNGKWLIKNLQLKFAVITLGEEGIYLIDKSGNEIYEPAQPLTVYDVTGAGDSVLATLGLALASEYSYQTALQLANLAAGVVVSKVGTATVSRNEIIDHFNILNKTHDSGLNKIKSLNELISTIRNPKSEIRNSTIVFTNGCFDILHPGHIKTLSFAKSQGDILVVGLNSDKSVRAIKGPGRPIFKQELRARSLAALESVDYIVIFNEPTPAKLISKIKPDILVKGADWKGKKVVGADFIKSYGGKIVLSPMEKGISTTKLLLSTGLYSAHVETLS